MSTKGLEESAQSSNLVECCRDVAAIIVTYRPDPEILLRGLGAIARQVGLVVVVDNASGKIPVASIENVARDTGIEAKVIVLPRNEGLGTAINVGIGEARSGGYPYIILFDQDSVPEVGMVALLKQAYQDLSEEGVRIGAVGPQFRAPESGRLSDFIGFGMMGIRRIGCSERKVPVRVGHLISSGSFIPMHAIDAVGEMDERLFIDSIDTEWCLRAESKGWRVYGVCSAIMEHSLGENRIRLWLFRWRSISCHASFRYYYIFRNILDLIRRNYIRPRCKMGLILNTLKLFFILLLILPDKANNLNMMRKGILDGLRGTSGPMVMHK